MRALGSSVIDAVRSADRAIGHRGDERRILVDARTPVNYTMTAPLYRRMASDSRVEFYWTASEEPHRIAEIYADAPGVQMISPARAAWMRFDAYIASDFMWAALPRGACRIQIFHGVAGKYGFDAPTTSMRQWDRLFFINRRRLGNYLAAGAIDPDSPAIRLVGMPKADRIVDGTFTRNEVIAGLGLDPALPTVLYAPTRSPESSLNAFGLDIIRGLRDLPVNLVVKLHDRQRDLRMPYSGGIDWVAAITPWLGPRTALATDPDISPYLVAADLMITDHSSAGFEFLLCDRPLVRIHRPALLEKANIHPDYAMLLASAADSVETAADTVRAVERGLADPSARSRERRGVAADLFYEPGSATSHAVRELYQAIELDPLPCALTAGKEAPCQLSLS